MLARFLGKVNDERHRVWVCGSGAKLATRRANQRELSVSIFSSVETWLLGEGVRPWGVALATFAGVILVLLLACWRDRTLFLNRDDANPDAHGLISAINAYLPITIPLNYAIFAFYHTSDRELATLISSGTLAGNVEDRYRFLSLLLSGVAYAIAVWLGILGHRFATTRGSAYTNWLVTCGRARPIAFYFRVIFVLQLALVFNWFLQNLLLWSYFARALNHAALDPFSLDSMFGLEPLSEITGRSFVVISLIAILVAVWLVGARITLRPRSFAENSGHLAAALAWPLCAVVGAVLWLLPAHVAMERAQRAALHELAVQGRRTSDLLLQLVREGDADAVWDVRRRRETQQALYDEVESASTWPISPRTVRALPIGFLSPLLLPFLHDLLRKVVRSYRGWKAPANLRRAP